MKRGKNKIDLWFCYATHKHVAGDWVYVSRWLNKRNSIKFPFPLDYYDRRRFPGGEERGKVRSKPLNPYSFYTIFKWKGNPSAYFPYKNGAQRRNTAYLIYRSYWVRQEILWWVGRLTAAFLVWDILKRPKKILMPGSLFLTVSKLKLACYMPQAWKRYPILAYPILADSWPPSRRRFTYVTLFRVIGSVDKTAIRKNNSYRWWEVIVFGHFYKELAKRKNSFPEYIKT